MNNIAQRLSEISVKSPELEDIVRIYGAILPVLHKADIQFAPVALSQDQARKNLEAGHPLLYDANIEFDLYDVAGLIGALIDAAAENGGSLSASTMKTAIRDGGMDVLDIASLAIAEDKEKIMNTATSQALDPELLWTLTQFALKPAFFAARKQLSHLAKAMDWDRGICPVCGAVAILGELRDNHLAKYLRCGRCGADWRINRLQCHLCRNVDHHTMKILYEDNKPGSVRLDVCDKCKGYLKVITSFSPIAPEMISVEDLATLTFDYSAQRAGYSSSPPLPST
jgi:formate dehydrogenase maturation protein FdhE